MNPILKKIAFALLPAIVVFSMAEIGLRFSGWPQVTEAFEHNEPFWIVDPDLKQSSMPHNEENTSFVVSTNSDGLRSGHDIMKKANVQRVLTLGCSTTFGWGVGDTETYPSKLEYYLHQKGFKQVEVVNGGQPGYTSF